MDLLENAAAEFRDAAGFLVSALLIRTSALKTLRLPGWQRVEARLQTLLQVFQNEWNETHISYFVFGKASRTYSGRNVRKCTTAAPHVNGPKKPTMKSMAWFVEERRRSPPHRIRSRCSALSPQTMPSIHGGFVFRTVTWRRTVRTFAGTFASRITCAEAFSEIQKNSLCEFRSTRFENLQKGLQARFDALPPGKRKSF